MKNWKLIAIIAATAVTTALAVVFIYQKLNPRKNRMRFDSAEFEDEYDDLDCDDIINRSVEDEGIEIRDEEDDALTTEPFDEAELDTAEAVEANSLEEAAAMEEMFANTEADAEDK